MDVSLVVKDYELVVPLGGAGTTSSVKIFPRSNKDRVRHVFLRFSARDNQNERPLRQLLEDTGTTQSVVRLFLGENLRPRVLDFLRNEEKQLFTFSFDPGSFQPFSFIDADDDNLAKNVKAFDLTSFVLHSQNADTPDKRLTPVVDPHPIVDQ